MKKLYRLGWFLGLILTLVFLVTSVMCRDLKLAACGLVLAWQLKKHVDKIFSSNLYNSRRK